MALDLEYLKVSIPLWFSLRRAVLRFSSQIMDPSLEEEFLVPTLRVQAPRSWFKTEDRAEMADRRPACREGGRTVPVRVVFVLASDRIESR